MKHVVLVGMMGVGKTTVGRYVAERLERRFVDTDALIEEKEGHSIPQIFAAHGEAHFRNLELKMIRHVMDSDSAVVSIGGGAFVNPAVRDVLKNFATTFYLQATPETLILRIGTGETRPMLTQNAPAGKEQIDARLRKLLVEREPIYELADYTIATDDLACEQVGEAIVGYRSRFDSAT
jgi:shikimate kinase